MALGRSLSRVGSGGGGNARTRSRGGTMNNEDLCCTSGTSRCALGPVGHAACRQQHVPLLGRGRLEGGSTRRHLRPLQKTLKGEKLFVLKGCMRNHLHTSPRRW
eukprot:2849397-Alexandrium_andersonii.AAC.1